MPKKGFYPLPGRSEGYYHEHEGDGAAFATKGRDNVIIEGDGTEYKILSANSIGSAPEVPRSTELFHVNALNHWVRRC
ncbi:hypothetical protein A3D00_04580 [Candidatus Woesebacteria bacterium RIFCSPHIGHO2_02_FULL_38_9]|uniref:Uncharacterized protein n=1 Tax=Candidatus Woesebacteria bacterium RIFCSPHIGHO2_01_FULL_39_28 TaxID=1802496 RepID=A0A1F7YLB7_9BACT|nr:MAG: hypothetical protein A2627_00400 [Candidatus Woesebacteria bacterium RIFCSPHIGHO2_01_FULL_39_28]OGM31903.1 MAG: hypothetical protein A3D00_04580 [Candidatus Woesebacteria bacterium RIFCSPHIGHO2_02_FULL_38_9]OGM56727.1 MAG: hypothetical protein A3A50_05220 [Candidatus Woesebacteria bacterium RIFCSPLOWO2_01_FULL_38_20]